MVILLRILWALGALGWIFIGYDMAVMLWPQSQFLAVSAALSSGAMVFRFATYALGDA